MPVHPTGLGGSAVVPCSHCNARDEGPDPGICHRNRFGSNTIDDQPCGRCMEATHGQPPGLIGSLLLGATVAVTGEGDRIQCSYCSGTGYRKI